jgi:hypothetical protein
MQCPGCKSSNVEKLSHYWQSLPTESPLRLQYAPPGKPDSRYWIALAAIAAGIAFIASGAALAGLLVAVGGIAWGAVVHAGVQRYEAALADWEAARLCLACVGRF